MEYDYYLHKSEGFLGDYFGEVGKPIKVSQAKYYYEKARKARATKVPKDSPMEIVLLQAIINEGIHPTSYSAKELFKAYCPEASFKIVSSKEQSSVEERS